MCFFAKTEKFKVLCRLNKKYFFISFSKEVVRIPFILKKIKRKSTKLKICMEMLT